MDTIPKSVPFSHEGKSRARELLLELSCSDGGTAVDAQILQRLLQVRACLLGSSGRLLFPQCFDGALPGPVVSQARKWVRIY